jgi:hypothetical protein
MKVVPENERPQHAGPPAIRPPSEPVAVEPTQPPAIDPEQVRQFQQFQQFQELMRQQEGSPPVPWGTPVAPPPLWQRVLRSRLFRRLALLAILALTVPLWLPLALTGLGNLAGLAFGGDDANRPASETGGGKTETNLILDTNPYETVRKVYHHIAQNVPEQVCGRFNDEARQQFAVNNQVPTCEAAVAKLHALVDTTPGSKNAYAEVDFRGKMGQVPAERTTEINSCELGVTAGPRLGVFVLNRIAKDQWIISAHRNQRCPES